MIVRLGPLISAGSGVIGSVAFVQGRGVTIVRPVPPPHISFSSIALTARNRLANLRTHWSTLTSDQQTAWNVAGANINTTNPLGMSSPMNGFQYFIRVNTRLRQSGLDIDDEPPITGTDSSPTSVGAVFSEAGAFTVTASTPHSPTSGVFYVYGWPFWRNTDSKEVARLVFLKTAFGSSLSTDVRSEWEALFGTMVETQRFAVGVAQTFFNRALSPVVIHRDSVVA